MAIGEIVGLEIGSVVIGSLNGNFVEVPLGNVETGLNDEC